MKKDIKNIESIIEATNSLCKDKSKSGWVKDLEDIVSFLPRLKIAYAYMDSKSKRDKVINKHKELYEMLVCLDEPYFYDGRAIKYSFNLPPNSDYLPDYDKYTFDVRFCLWIELDHCLAYKIDDNSIHIWVIDGVYETELDREEGGSFELSKRILNIKST